MWGDAVTQVLADLGRLGVKNPALCHPSGKATTKLFPLDQNGRKIPKTQNRLIRDANSMRQARAIAAVRELYGTKIVAQIFDFSHKRVTFCPRPRP